ncbi:hypothetical protein TWF103_011696 [Orbilia oligospora]|nr:hypothetical protein TWF103_011696 [Orbilia oligospora]
MKASKSWKFNPPKPVEAQQKAPVWTPRRFSEVSIRLLCCGEGVALAVAISALDVNFGISERELAPLNRASTSSGSCYQYTPVNFHSTLANIQLT